LLLRRGELWHYKAVADVDAERSSTGRSGTAAGSFVGCAPFAARRPGARRLNQEAGSEDPA
jgi:hypothetical protein